MALKFSKMHGLGNDFIVIDAINQKFIPDPERIRAWARRQTGIGFDQLLLVEKAQSDKAAFKYRIFNADGGEVEQCGNGARCFARFVRERNLTDLDLIPVETRNGLIVLEMIDTSRARVNMGVPQFEPQQIPLDTDHRSEIYTLAIDGQHIQFSALGIGNPHIVIQVDDVDQAEVDTLGPALESHPFFPQRVNVGFMQRVDRGNFRLRVFERGAGETSACGSGACAAMVKKGWVVMEDGPPPDDNPSGDEEGVPTGDTLTGGAPAGHDAPPEGLELTQA
ncbi:MAG: diaminopimelate epimerase, partial [Proteobacteria bacterium]|nr:diaminopimelate epimerase [Pseudomonadota bacterium]